MNFTVDHLIALLSVIAEQQLRIAQLQQRVTELEHTEPTRDP